MLNNKTSRPAHPDDIPTLTDIWFAGWTEAHAAHVPASLTAIRTCDSFAIRLTDFLKNTLVVGPTGAPIGFVIVKEDEIYQLYLSPSGRGSGLANALMTAGLDRIRENGHAQASLDVIPQNARAIAFYTKRVGSTKAHRRLCWILLMILTRWIAW